MSLSLWSHLSIQISTVTQQSFNMQRHHSVAGGCINSAYIIEDQGQRYFVKVNSASHGEMFAAEAAGLDEIRQSQSVYAPKPILYGNHAGSAYLVLECLTLSRAAPSSMQTFGRQLAHMHKMTATQYGWSIDNTIGSTPQINKHFSNWIEFWRKWRLGYQLTLAHQNGFRGRLQKQGEKLLANMDVLLAGHHPPASLLHGDLWSGNYAFTDNYPVIFDPAVYYGDRETDIAMTELFGGFSTQFYEAYSEYYPLDANYQQRKNLYNLYHILNHLNLFGGGYASQAERMMDLLLSEL